jgi:hypothetical protein
MRPERDCAPSLSKGTDTDVLDPCSGPEIVAPFSLGSRSSPPGPRPALTPAPGGVGNKRRKHEEEWVWWGLARAELGGWVQILVGFPHFVRNEAVIEHMF